MRLIFLLLLPLLLFGAKARVSLEIDRAQEFFVFLLFIATLKVKTTAFSISDLDVDLGDNSDFIIIAPSSAAYINSEEIGDETYQYSVYEYELYPLKANGVSLKPLEVSFNVSSGYGQAKEHFTLSTSQKELFISSPKGVEGFILATPKLSIKTTYSDNKKSYKLGDGITQTISITAFDVPDVLIPKITFSEIEGMKLYEDESRLSQKKGETHLVSKRIQSATYIFMQDGNFTLESQKMPWYNTPDSQIKSESSKSYSFEVVGETLPIVAEEQSSKAYKKELLVVLLSLIGFVVLFYVIWRFRRRKNRDKYTLEKRINPK